MTSHVGVGFQITDARINLDLNAFSHISSLDGVVNKLEGIYQSVVRVT